VVVVVVRVAPSGVAVGCAERWRVGVDEEDEDDDVDCGTVCCAGGGEV
jgi:hypothetical protein